MTRSSFDLTPHLSQLREVFGDRLQEGAPLAQYTAARVGGEASALVRVTSAGELANAARRLWRMDLPFLVLGGGSNMLVSDKGVNQVVLLNHARAVRFDEAGPEPSVWAESGANFGLLARMAVAKGLAGLEWAAGIPGTLGGAVFGNAGAHGGDMAGSLLLAEILHRKHVRSETGKEILPEQWRVDELAYEYRSSRLKQTPGDAVILSAVLRLERVSQDQIADIQTRMESFTKHRRRTQPPGASMGSMFKNPSGDYAGRLIEAAGLKGFSIGGAEISSLHANFFINRGSATAADIHNLIKVARREVAEQFGVQLELEIELVGDWDE
jgi:UDP-N-acetylmuramate dehydrogenase